MIPFSVVGLPQSQLDQMTEPGLATGGQSEAIAWTFYDTAPYVDAVTTQLEFFTTARANRQATNLNTPGQIQAKNWFQIYWFGANLLIDPAVDAWQDGQSLLQGGVNGPPTWQFTLNDKVYGPFPFMQLHAMGGITGFGTATSLNYTNSAVPGSVGAWQDGAIVIPPQQGFRLRLDWDAAQNISANTLIQVFMTGVLHRRVV